MIYRCDYYDDHDEVGNPCGNRCNMIGTHKIHWRDGRWSMGCDAHSKQIVVDVPDLICEVTPLLGSEEAG